MTVAHLLFHSEGFWTVQACDLYLSLIFVIAALYSAQMFRPYCISCMPWFIMLSFCIAVGCDSHSLDSLNLYICFSLQGFDIIVQGKSYNWI